MTHHTRSQRTLRGFLVAAALVLGGCSSSSSIDSTYDYNKAVDFSGYQTYAFISKNPMGVSQAQGPINPMLEGRLMESEKKPDCEIVARRKGYALYANGELWTTGKYGYRAGYVMDPENIDIAIDEAEEEMRCLEAEARAEFG